MLKKQIIPIVRAFQSALPRGERQQIGGSPDEDRNISIHAPTRGATCLCLDKYRLIHISIHAPTRGATPMLQLRYSRKPISIHAPTRGATYNGAKYFIHCADFNPRSHEGSDKAISCKNKRKCKISIHAPTRGATDINLSGIVATEISIHAPTRGATSCADKHSACSFYFNPRSHEGSDDRTRRAVV